MHKPIKTTESCQDTSDSSVSAAIAQQRINDNIAPLKGYISVPLRNALGAVLAEPVISPINVPAYRNSAMDGYALHSSDLPEKGDRELNVVGTAFAGKPFNTPLKKGECIRIMTGAKMPDDFDTVLIQERVERIGDSIRLDSSHSAGGNVRQAGEDIPRKSVVLDTGSKIGPAELGLLASLGIPEVSIRRPVRVAFFSSGDEIRSLGEALEEGQIYDSNRYTLFGMLTQLGVEVIDMGVIPDQQQAITDAMELAAREADMVLTSGGVSVGEADHIADSIRKLGRIHFSKVAIKPGRPLTFGHIGETAFFGLPGNPVAVMITFLQFVRPALKRLMGEQTPFTPALRVPCSSALRKSPGRTEYQRGILHHDESGQLTVRTTGRQGSGVLSSMSSGNCFILLDEETGNISEGDKVQVQPFDLLWH